MLGFSPIAAMPIASGGGVSFLASLAAAEAPDVAAFAANNQNVYFALTEAADVTNFNIEIRGTVALAATEAPDTFEGYIYFANIGYLEASEASDTASFVIWNTNASFALTEAPDTAAFNTVMTGSVLIAATEAPDNYSQNAYILWLTPDQPDDPTIWVPKNDPTPYLTTVI
jgi:hypothetical protein